MNRKINGSGEVVESGVYEILSFNETVIQKIINSNLRKTYWRMQGKGGFHKTSLVDIKNKSLLNIAYSEFREEGYLESSLIYVEACNSYNPDHFLETGKGDGQIKFTSWLYCKLADLESRMFRIMATGSTSLDTYVDTGKNSTFTEIADFRISLSATASILLDFLELGNGFREQKSGEYHQCNCHLGFRSFYENFIKNNESCLNMTYTEFFDAWNELKEGWSSLTHENDSMVFTISEVV